MKLFGLTLCLLVPIVSISVDKGNLFDVELKPMGLSTKFIQRKVDVEGRQANIQQFKKQLTDVSWGLSYVPEKIQHDIISLFNENIHCFASIDEQSMENSTILSREMLKTEVFDKLHNFMSEEEKRNWWAKLVRTIIKRTPQALKTVTDSVTKVGLKVITIASKKVVSEFNQVTVEISHAANQVEKMTARVERGVSDAMKKVADAAQETARFSKNAIEDIRDFAVEVNGHLTKVVETINLVLKSLQCDITPKKLLEFAKELVNGRNQTSIFNLFKSPERFKKLASGSTKIARVACQFVWGVIDKGLGIINAIIQFIALLTKSCPILKNTNLAISLGVGVGASASLGPYNVGASAELGLAVDMRGQKYCYIGGCVTNGALMPPLPSVATDTGIFVTIWKNPGRMIGRSYTVGISGEMGLAGLKISAGLTYMYGSPSNLGDFSGFGVTGKVGAVSLPVVASLGFSTGVCHTPLCISPAGCECGSCKSRSLIDKDTEIGGNTSLEVTQMMYALPASDTSEECAKENEKCHCKGNVFYGADNNWLMKEHRIGDIWCKNSVFGDAAPGVTKTCICVGQEYDIGNLCASENEQCVCSGSVTFGTLGYWNSKLVRHNVTCNNQHFGDPAPGYPKSCYCKLPEYNRKLIRVPDSDFCLDGYHGSKFRYVYKCNKNNKFQIWTYNPTTKLIKNAKGPCLTCANTTIGATCDVSTCKTGDITQQFEYDFPTMLLKSVNAQKCLDNPKRSNNQPVFVWPCSVSNPNQRWVFTIG